MKTDCLIIGSGIAGLTVALSLAEKGMTVTVISAAETMMESNTQLAQGGIIFQPLEGSEEKLYRDITTAGHQANYPPAVEQLARLGPKLVQEILINKSAVP